MEIKNDTLNQSGYGNFIIGLFGNIVNVKVALKTHIENQLKSAYGWNTYYKCLNKYNQSNQWTKGYIHSKGRFTYLYCFRFYQVIIIIFCILYT